MSNKDVLCFGTEFDIRYRRSIYVVLITGNNKKNIYFCHWKGKCLVLRPTNKAYFMRKLALVVVAMMPLVLIAQNIRSYDGSNNNPRYTDWGATHTILPRLAAPEYADQVSVPKDSDVLPRSISNSVMYQPVMYHDSINVVSDYFWAFGQLIDHDVILTENGTEDFCSDIPTGDPAFDPFNEGDKELCIKRSEFEPNTGMDADNPREHVNGITAWIDGSSIYGSDQERAAWLRSFIDGKLKVSEGDLLPWNTLDGEFDSPIDPTSPFMADDTHRNLKLMVAGDLRANENILLSVLHNLFLREHNRLCDVLKEENPNWSDEQLYQYARKMVGGMLQNITFNEWLPVAGIDLGNYVGYNPELNPNISNEFSAFAFRIGHTLINQNLLRMNLDGTDAEGGAIHLRDAFFNPLQYSRDGMCMYLKGATCQEMQMFDRMVIDDLRNFLFGPPGAGGLDLATINIMRGRERGIADFNTIRESIGLNPYSRFGDICKDEDSSEKLRTMYPDVNSIDPWVGVLSEKPMDNAIFGETTVEILRNQFLALREGDRFYFLIDPMLSLRHKQEILSTKLSHIISRNSCMAGEMHEDAFHAVMPVSNVEEAGFADNITIYPNPVINDNVRISLEMKYASNVEIQITSLTGTSLYSDHIHVPAGAYHIQVPFSSAISAGTYILTIKTESDQYTSKLLKF